MLDYLAFRPENATRFRKDRELMNSMLRIVTDKSRTYEEDPLREATEELFGSLGIWRKYVEENRLIVTLCSARDVPRLCSKDTFIQVLPKELIRKIATALCD